MTLARGLAVRSIEPLGEGDYCHAYLVNGSQVVRVPKHATAAAALAREACVLPRIARFLPATVPIPNFSAGADPGSSFALHDHVAGHVLTADERAGRGGDHAFLAQALGRFLAALHGVDLALVVPCGLPRLDAVSAAARLRDGLESGSIVPDPAGSTARALTRCLDEDLLGHPPALLHGDVSPGHVMVGSDDELAGVIDWGDGVLGDPARDFIFLYEDWGDDFLRHALIGYAPSDPDSFRVRVLAHYLVDQLEWTADAAAAGRLADVEHGVAALAKAISDFERSA